MNRKLKLVIAVWLLLVATSFALANSRPGQRVSFNQDWRFHLGEVTNGQDASLDDSRWRRLDLPHDIRVTAFLRQVWEQLRAIPYGHTVLYGDVA